MATLNGTVAFAKMHHITMSIGQDLKFDVPRILNVFLKIYGGVVERLFGLAAGHVVFLGKRHIVMRYPHTAPASSCNRLDDNRIADLSSDLHRFRFRIDRPVGSRNRRHSGLLHRLPGDRLVTHDLYRLRLRTDESDVAGFALLGEFAVLGKKAISWVDCL